MNTYSIIPTDTYSTEAAYNGYLLMALFRLLNEGVREDLDGTSTESKKEA